ncbi:MAG: hypothetical protein Q4C74_07175 [Rothia sp. (in: high G+C Gram-positive bacteria)]|nr:hypothetical protein [Rothia sp. (in: high G+C Gram-positive bacteria)]
MTVVEAGQNVANGDTVTAYQNKSLKLDVLGNSRSVTGVHGLAVEVRLLNMYGTPLTWLGTSHGVAYLAHNQIIFDADSAGDFALDYQVIFSDQTSENRTVYIQAR